MRWTAVLFALVLATPATAQGIDGGFAVTNACAEIWATKTSDDTIRIFEVFSGQYGERAGLLYSALDEATLSYEAAKETHATAEKALTDALEEMAAAGGDLVLRNLISEAQTPKDASAWDAAVDAAVGTGKNASQIAEVAAQFGASSDLLDRQKSAEQAMKAARKKQLEIQAQGNAIEAIMAAIEVCARDQIDFLDLGIAPETQAVLKPDPGDLRPFTFIRDQMGFRDEPSLTFDVKDPSGGAEGAPLYWPEVCQSQCLADANCIAWNYIHSEPQVMIPSAQCRIYDVRARDFTGYSMTKSWQWSGWGPAAVKEGWAKAP